MRQQGMVVSMRGGSRTIHSSIPSPCQRPVAARLP